MSALEIDTEIDSVSLSRWQWTASCSQGRRANQMKKTTCCPVDRKKTSKCKTKNKKKKKTLENQIVRDKISRRKSYFSVHSGQNWAFGSNFVEIFGVLLNAYHRYIDYIAQIYWLRSAEIRSKRKPRLEGVFKNNTELKCAKLRT